MPWGNCAISEHPLLFCLSHCISIGSLIFISINYSSLKWRITAFLKKKKKDFNFPNWTECKVLSSITVVNILIRFLCSSSLYAWHIVDIQWILAEFNCGIHNYGSELGNSLTSTKIIFQIYFFITKVFMSEVFLRHLSIFYSFMIWWRRWS